MKDVINKKKFDFMSEPPRDALEVAGKKVNEKKSYQVR